MAKKKKKPLVPPPLKSLKLARRITSAFHAATRALDGALAQGDAEAAASARAAVEAAGGREKYQEASAAATARHKVASKFVWSQLTRLGFREKTRGGEKPRLLEIGAINTQLLSTPWLRVRSVDLRAPPAASSPSPSASSSPPDGKKERRRIEAIDFFDVARLPQRNEFDAVVCSMVLNCLTTPEQRGEMLRGIRRHLKFGGGEGDGGGGSSATEKEEARGGKSGGKGGVAFIMLPRRCVEASRACDWRGFERCLARAGLGEVVARKASAKVALWLVRATGTAAGSSSSSSSGSDDEDSATIAAAHAAGEFAVNMREAGTGGGGGGGGGGAKREKKEKGGKRFIL